MGSFDYHSGVNWNLVLDSEQLLISQVIERRHILWLCHFTPRSNLENIKRSGLKTRDLLSNWETTVTDQARFDQHRNAICLSISKPNNCMFNKKCEQGFDLCLLLISPEILYKKNCLFFPHNAATASYRNINIESLKGEQALENLFANPISFQKSGKPPQDIFRFHYLLDCETTSDQAEVQCLDNIEPQYITHIFEENIPSTYDEILNQVEKINDFNLSKRDISQTISQNPVRRTIRGMFPPLNTQSMISDIQSNKEVSIEWSVKRLERWSETSLERKLEPKKEMPVLETQKEEIKPSKSEPDVVDLLGLLDRVVDKTLDATDKALYKAADKADEFLEKDKRKSYNSSTSSEDGDGCVSWVICIVLAILMIILCLR